MNPKLREADQRAVDLVLDQVGPLIRGEDERQRFSGNSGDDQTMQRVNATQKLLRLLDELPAPSVPATLAERTLRRIDQRHAAPGASAKPQSKTEQPPAS